LEAQAKIQKQSWQVLAQSSNILLLL
jgi:hypothetical protein